MIFKKPIFAQLLAAFTANLNMFTTALWLGWPAIMIPQIMSGEIPIPMTDDKISWAVALMDIGNLLSPLPSGYLMDRFGRLFTIRLTALIFVATSVFAIIATQPYHLYILRFLAGIGSGICFTVTIPYLGEIAGVKNRGMLNGLFGLMGAGGSILSYSFGLYITFRLFSWLSIIAPILTVILSLIISESPYFFFMRNRNKDAESAFCWFRGDEIDDTNTSELVAVQKKVESDMQENASFSEVFAGKANRKAVCIVLFTAAVQKLGGGNSVGAYGTIDLLPTPFWTLKLTLLITGFAALAANIISTTLIDSFGRKPLLLISLFAMTCVSGTFAVFYYLLYESKVNMEQVLFLPHVVYILFGVFYSSGINQIPFTLQSELLPTNIKSRVSAISTIVLSITSFAINKVYLSVRSNLGLYMIHSAFCISNLLGFIFTLFCVFETKGKTLVEIQEILNKS